MNPLEIIQSQVDVINEALSKENNVDVGDASAEEEYYKDRGYCPNCKAHIGDGHDCDNCAFCGTEPY